MTTKSEIDELLEAVENSDEDTILEALRAVLTLPGVDDVVVAAVRESLACDLCGRLGPYGMCQATVSPATLYEPAEACDRCAHNGEFCREHDDDPGARADHLHDLAKEEGLL